MHDHIIIINFNVLQTDITADNVEEVIVTLTTTVLLTNEVQDQISDNLEIITDVLERTVQLLENNQLNISMEIVNTVSIISTFISMLIYM